MSDHDAKTLVPMDIDFDAMMYLGDIPEYFAAKQPDAIATVFEGRETSWKTFAKHTRQVANGLIKAGCKVGDHIAVASKNCDELFEIMFGASLAGVIFTPIIHRLSPVEMAGIVKDCDPELLFVGKDLIGDVETIGSTLKPSSKIISLEGEGDNHQAFAAWRNAQDDSHPDLDLDVHTVAVQLYTSGTTGKPKGVMLSHHNMLAMRRESAKHSMPWSEWMEGDVNLVAMPNGHIGGVGWGLVGFSNGAKSVIHRDFLPMDVPKSIEEDGISKLFVVPTALQILLMMPNVREIDYSRLRDILYGAAPIALDLLREATEVFGCGFCQQYGMTETTGTIVYLPPEDHDPNGNQRMRGAGKAMPGVQLRIRDESGKVLGANQTGEIEIRSSSNMEGYYNQADQYAKTVDREGWLKTGDAGFLDEDGYLYIQDRIKDMICSGAENVYPAEVESAIYGHPAIQEIAVIGVPHEKWGEAVKAIVVLKPDHQATEQDIIDFARERIAGFKVPKSVDFIDVLPKNPTGKILRRELRAPYWEGRDRQVN